MTVAKLGQQLRRVNRIVDEDGRPTREFLYFLDNITTTTDLNADETTTAQTDAAAAQASANAAQSSADSAQTTADYASHFIEPNLKTGHQWQSDSAGAWTTGNPTENLGIKVKDKNGTEVAARVLQGLLTTSTGLISVTAFTDSASTGYSTSFVVQANASANPRGDITITYPDGTTSMTTVGWAAVDQSGTSSTPGGGGGK